MLSYTNFEITLIARNAADIHIIVNFRTVFAKEADLPSQSYGESVGIRLLKVPNDVSEVGLCICVKCNNDKTKYLML